MLGEIQLQTLQLELQTLKPKLQTSQLRLQTLQLKSNKHLKTKASLVKF
jgi:hypothetical protein